MTQPLSKLEDVDDILNDLFRVMPMISAAVFNSNSGLSGRIEKAARDNATTQINQLITNAVIEVLKKYQKDTDRTNYIVMRDALDDLIANLKNGEKEL